MQTAAHPQKRTGLTIGAWVAAVLGVLVLAAGVTGIWASSSKRDHNGYFSANAHRYQTHTRAIATDSITVGSYVPTWLAGKVRLDVSGDKPLFVGIAPKATVDALPRTHRTTRRRPSSISIRSRSPTSTTPEPSTRAGPQASRSGRQPSPVRAR